MGENGPKNSSTSVTRCWGDGGGVHQSAKNSRLQDSNHHFELLRLFEGMAGTNHFYILSESGIFESLK